MNGSFSNRGLTNFTRPWTAYQTGFGVWSGEYWMGLEKINQMTTQGSWNLRIELQGKTDSIWLSVEYDNFVVGSSGTKYRLQVSTYCWGDAPNVLNNLGSNNQNGMMFTTYDFDNDRFSGNCANVHAGGFWYNSCFGLNVNGNYNELKFFLPSLTSQL